MRRPDDGPGVFAPGCSEPSEHAGFGVVGPIEDLSIDDFRRQFETNVFGVLHTVKPAIPARSSTEACTKASLPPPSRTMKPKPFCALNHLTVPTSSTAVSSDGRFAAG